MRKRAHQPLPGDVRTAPRPWERDLAPGRIARFVGRRVGLSGKLVGTYTAVLLITILLSILGLRWEAGRHFREVARHSAQQMTAAVAVAMSEDVNDRLALNRLAQAASAGGGRVRVLAPDRKTVITAAGDLVLPKQVSEEGFFPLVLTPSVLEDTTLNADGVPVLFTRAPLYNGDKLAGFVDVAVPAQEEAFDNLAQRAIAIGLSCCVLGQLFVGVLVRRAVGPLRKFTSAADRLAKGERYVPMDLRRADEIGDLARSFDAMAQTVVSQRDDLETVNGELAEINRELEDRITRRTAQVEAANDRLNQEIAEKEDFLRAVSHDLNAPLRNISGMVTMIQRKHGETLDEDIVRRLDRVQKNVENEVALIDELLELSRIKTHVKQFDELELVDLEALLWELRGMFESDMRERRIDIRIATTFPRLRCEKARMRQVFQNLIDNAIKYMGEGSEDADGLPVRTITLGCQQNHTEAEFYVQDTGQGIPAEDVDKVFFVFRRASNHGDTAGKGVGLASVKSIVETYNGTIWVESEQGKGSTFLFTVNARFVDAGQTGQTAVKPSGTRADAKKDDVRTTRAA